MSYLSVGRPVFGFVNKDNELMDIINSNGLGYLCDDTNGTGVRKFVSEVDRITSSYDALAIQHGAKNSFAWTGQSSRY